MRYSERIDYLKKLFDSKLNKAVAKVCFQTPAVLLSSTCRFNSRALCLQIPVTPLC